MTNKKNQKGVGMMEVLVALIVLAIAVLGFTALQLRAVSSTDEALQKVNAMDLARNLAERIRANRSGYESYISNFKVGNQMTAASSCLNSICSSSQMANFDTSEILSIAKTSGMKIAMQNCQVTGAVARQCIYVAWDKTQPTNGMNETDCTNNGAYQPTASCVVMELY